MKKVLILFSLVIFAVHMLDAQITLKGKVVNNKGGKPVEGVTIAAKNGAGKILIAKQTDAAGKFTIDLPKEAVNIVVSKDGYQPRTLPVGKKKSMKIKIMQE